VSQTDENLATVRAVIGVFDRLQIPYALGGSMASSIHGTPRLTLDADLTAEPFPGKEAQFIASFGSEYYLDLGAVSQALSGRSSFNVINTNTGFKVDVFIRKDRPFEFSLMQRRLSRTLSDVPDQPIILVSPEDIILLKLEWYRLGDETSERQWRDVLGVLEMQEGRLDDSYLDHWAAELKISDLLALAGREAAGGEEQA